MEEQMGGANLYTLVDEEGKEQVFEMLDSMERRPVPTRAEVSDIFRAVAQGASSLMLTGETAIGAYPVEAMGYLVKTAKASQEYLNKNC